MLTASGADVPVSRADADDNRHDARMTIVSDREAAPAPVRPTRSSDVLVALLLIAAEVVLGWYRYDLARAFSHHVSGSDPVQWFFLVLPYLPLAAVVTLHALTRGRALAAGLVALSAGGVMIAYSELLEWLGSHPSVDPNYHQLQAIGYAVLMTVAVLAALAWGLSRRHGRWWPIGLLVAAAGAALTIWTSWPEHVAWGHSSFTSIEGDDNPIRRYYLVHTVAQLIPVVAACVTCWLIERAELRRPPPPG
jgi:hypothetical protein